jgi:hypothetical protein
MGVVQVMGPGWVYPLQWPQTGPIVRILPDEVREALMPAALSAAPPSYDWQSVGFDGIDLDGWMATVDGDKWLIAVSEDGYHPGIETVHLDLFFPRLRDAIQWLEKNSRPTD